MKSVKPNGGKPRIVEAIKYTADVWPFDESRVELGAQTHYWNGGRLQAATPPRNFVLTRDAYLSLLSDGTMVVIDNDQHFESFSEVYG